MIRIKILKNMSESLKKKRESGLRALFLFSITMGHPHVKCSLLLLIVLVTSKLAPEQNYSAARNLCDKSQT